MPADGRAGRVIAYSPYSPSTSGRTALPMRRSCGSVLRRALHGGHQRYEPALRALHHREGRVHAPTRRSRRLPLAAATAIRQAQPSPGCARHGDRSPRSGANASWPSVSPETLHPGQEPLPEPTGVIPDGHYYVAGAHPDSLDSRPYDPPRSAHQEGRVPALGGATRWSRCSPSAGIVARPLVAAPSDLGPVGPVYRSWSRHAPRHRARLSKGALRELARLERGGSRAERTLRRQGRPGTAARGKPPGDYFDQSVWSARGARAGRRSVPAGTRVSLDPVGSLSVRSLLRRPRSGPGAPARRSRTTRAVEADPRRRLPSRTHAGVADPRLPRPGRGARGGLRSAGSGSGHREGKRSHRRFRFGRASLHAAMARSSPSRSSARFAAAASVAGPTCHGG
jgi:hypothetical protein